MIAFLETYVLCLRYLLFFTNDKMIAWHDVVKSLVVIGK